jgi:tRNA(Ile)-lysidine synthase
LSWRHVQDVLGKVARGKVGARIDLPGVIAASRDYDHLVFSVQVPGKTEPADGSLELEVPGRLRLPGKAGLIEATVVPAAEAVFERESATEFIRPDVALPLEVRSPYPGEKFHPLGAGGSRKISRFLRDRKVPRRHRKDCLVVTSGGEVVLVIGLRLDERFRLEERSSSAIRLRLVEGD